MIVNDSGINEYDIMRWITTIYYVIIAMTAIYLQLLMAACLYYE